MEHSLPSSPRVMGERGEGVEQFFRRFIKEGLMSNWDIGQELAL